uniref:Uncharacterized protein n=1 Tax=Arundo donax TaxID=35708 RepID=A0A0A9HCK5_ARUDO
MTASQLGPGATTWTYKMSPHPPLFFCPLFLICFVPYHEGKGK